MPTEITAISAVHQSQRGKARMCLGIMSQTQ